METQTGQKITRRYSAAFKRKVVMEIEGGKFTVNAARKFYDIHGGATIERWLKQHGKAHLLTEVVTTTLRTEKKRETAFQERITLLEKALADAHLKIFVLESTVTVLERQDTKKKSSDTKSLKSA